MKGKLLIANPRFPSSNPFAKSVIYLYQHNSVLGSSGVVLNKSSSKRVSDFAGYDIGFEQYCNNMIHLGGPVNPAAMILLHSDDWKSSNTVEVGNRLRISSDEGMFDRLGIGPEPAYWRMFFGYSGWSVGQLESEIEGKNGYDESTRWLLADPTDELMFLYDNEEQWEKSLEHATSQIVDSWF